jgi:hypothetical protein
MSKFATMLACSAVSLSLIALAGLPPARSSMRHRR